jgi:hypothetical protein
MSLLGRRFNALNNKQTNDMETLEQHFSTWTGTPAMRDAIIAELEALPNELGVYSTPVYQKEYTDHRWYPTGVFGKLHHKAWDMAIETIKQHDPEFYAKYATKQATEQATDYRALYEQAQREIKMLELELSHARNMVELYKSFIP